MKKQYIQPSIEAMTVNAVSNLCAVSTTENFGIIDPAADPSNQINADQGR